MKYLFLALALLFLATTAAAQEPLGATCICYPICEYLQMGSRWDPSTWAKHYAYWGEFVSTAYADGYINYPSEVCWDPNWD